MGACLAAAGLLAAAGPFVADAARESTRIRAARAHQAQDLGDLVETVPARPPRTVELALSRCDSKLDDAERTRIADAVEREAERHGYDPLFVQALVEIESTCAPHARSRAGALGLAQIRPSTGRAVARDTGVPWRGDATLFDPDANLRLGMAYLRQLEARFGDVRLAVAAYNLGPERVAGMAPERARRNGYVKRVLGRWAKLRSEHGLS
ncbi:MAG: transglycosylase SLT domain-containing protein [Alphaproteobacteria bacterium]